MATVLVVDDVAANRELMAMLLGYRGHEVIEASDGADALALAQSRHPDVVVSDVLMPGIDGLELVHRLRSAPDERAAHAPVIFYTANYLEPETRPIAEACGVSQVVLRSADPRELLDAVDVALRNGPVEITPRPADEFAAVHARAINAKLVEKVRALRHTERRFEAMAASSPVGIVLLDADGFATYANPRLSEITGLPADRLLERGWLACLEPDTHAEAVEVVRAGPAHAADAVEHRYRNRFVRDDGDARWLRVHLRPIGDAETGLAGAVVMVDDVTDLVAAEERAAREMRQRQDEARRRDAERLDSLRRMAGGMAHDFNNLLGAMLGFLTLAIEQITEEMEAGRLSPAAGAALLGDLGQVTKGGERATKLTEQLLAFGRREISQPAVVDVDKFLADAAGALAEAAGPGIKLDLRPGDVPPVMIDPRLLERLLHILVHNARDAMPDGGTITVTTGRVPATGHATISVADDGRGMPADVRARAFEPFFSTKAGSRTAGLGLATAHGVVTQAGGELTLTSAPGQGTTVLITLPAAPAATGTAADATKPGAAPAVRGTQTVLLVDDERDLREVTARFIAKAGYQVLTAANGNEALRVAEQHADAIDCLVTDVMMPGMDGRQLAHRFLSDRPDTKVVFISGYAEALIDDQGRSLEPGRTILAKPFTSAELTAALKSVLAG
ncbi:ATP-binding response regulator [Paractinoplanes globisporus]|uniref:histidine kinase n=1 Tax=Paractinoplanes globisporus TaxID=113565 RepID=A0ABW6WT48_9ACTN|nr:response regulator [Actinoplanes globisporus]